MENNININMQGSTFDPNSGHWEFRNTTGQVVTKILVSLFLFPIGLLILLWKGSNQVWVPNVPQQTVATQPPGWYPCPTGWDGQRWWDGRQWTAQTSPNADPVSA